MRHGRVRYRREFYGLLRLFPPTLQPTYSQLYYYSATTHPNLPFYFIVNPNSGPGGINTQPDANYQACVPKLRPAANPNVKILGYVRTNYGATPQSDVQAEVKTYAGWGSAYRPTGIFYDEVLATSDAQSLYSAYTSYAKAQISNAFVRAAFCLRKLHSNRQLSGLS